MSETLFQELGRYVGFGPRDVELLADLHPVLEQGFVGVAEEFYDKTREHAAAHAVFTDEAQIDRLKRSLVAWMHRIFSGPHDEAYFERTAKIGAVHVRIGLPHRYMYTAMSLVRVKLTELALAAPTITPAHVDALHKVLDLELAVMADRYFSEVLARAQRAERVELEAVLERTEHRYASAVEMADLLIVGVDKDGIVQLFNREAERVSGVMRSEALGAPFLELLVPEDARAEIARAFELLRHPGSSVGSPVASDAAAPAEHGAALVINDHASLESTIVSSSGKLRDITWQLSYRPSREEDGVDVFAIGRDTTGERELAARARQNERLAAVGTLAAGLAHEIRNPLNGALLHVTFLERAMKKLGSVDDDAQEALSMVRSEIKRLSALTTEFLDFARPHPIDRATCDLGNLCQRVAAVAAAKAEQAGIEIRLDLPKNPLTTAADAPRLEQVLLNLAHNGIDAMDPAGGVLLIRVRRRPIHAIIEVEDAGGGISPGAPVFDPFYSTKPTGTGLGLAIAHSIVTAHGGELTFESQMGKTIFRISLPMVDAPTSHPRIR